MADAKRKALPKFTTPKLTFKFPKLSAPDYGSKDYPKPDGEYSVKGVLPLADMELFMRRTIRFDGREVSLKDVYDAAVAEGRAEFAKLKVETRKKLGEVKINDLFTTLYDQETEEETGEVELKFSMKASGEYKKGPKTGQRWNRKPDLYDAKGLPMRKVPEIWGGTVGKIAFEASPYFIPGTGAVGLKLALTGAQIIDLVQGGTRTAASHGFGEEEGYSHDDSATEDEAAGQFSNEETEKGADDSDGNPDF